MRMSRQARFIFLFFSLRRRFLARTFKTEKYNSFFEAQTYADGIHSLYYVVFIENLARENLQNYCKNEKDRGALNRLNRRPVRSLKQTGVTRPPSGV